MHLLRRWSKHSSEHVGYGQGEAYADDFYKQVAINFFHNGKEIRKIIFKNAYLYKYEEKIDVRDNTGIFALTVRQNQTEKTGIVTAPFNTVYTYTVNYVPQEDPKPTPDDNTRYVSIEYLALFKDSNENSEVLAVIPYGAAITWSGENTNPMNLSDLHGETAIVIQCTMSLNPRQE